MTERGRGREYLLLSDEPMDQQPHQHSEAQ